MGDQQSSSFTEEIRQKIQEAQQNHDGEFLSLLPADDSLPPDSDTDKAHFTATRRQFESHLDTMNETTLTASEFQNIDELNESLDQLNRTVAELTGDSRRVSFLRRLIRKLIHVGIGRELHSINQSLSAVTRIANALNNKTRQFAASQQTFNSETAVFGQRIIPVIDEKIKKQLDVVSGYLKDRMDAYHEGTDRRQTEIANWLTNTMLIFNDTQELCRRTEAEMKRGLALQHRKLEQALAIDPSTRKDSETPQTASRRQAVAEPYAPAGGEYAYYLFETQGRGSETYVRELQADFIRFFIDCPGSVLDVGCGRGEFLELLKQHDLNATGIDANPDMVSICRSRQLNVVEADAVDYIQRLEDSSLGGVFAGQVVEHMPSAELNRWMQQVFRVLKPGGIVVFETINTSSPFALTSHFFKDPTHQLPRHPDTYRFITEIAGFDGVTVTLRSPVDANVKPRIPPLPDDLKNVSVDPVIRKLRQALEQTIDYIYSPCDIVVYGRKPETLS